MATVQPTLLSPQDQPSASVAFQPQVPASFFLRPCGKLPSLGNVSPWLRLACFFVLGNFDEARPFWFTYMALFWGFLSVVGFVMFGPFLGDCGGGMAANFAIACLFLVALLCFFFLRAALFFTLDALRPLLEQFEPREGSVAYNTKKSFNADSAFFRNLVATLFTAFPLGVIGIWVFLFQSPGQLIATEACFRRVYIGVQVSFAVFFFTTFLLALQVTLLFAVCRLYIFRCKVLYAALVRNDQELLRRELSTDTPVSARILLAAPPKGPGPVPQGDGGYISHPPLEQTEAAQQDLDRFLLVYRSIAEEAKRHALLWSAPIITFLVGYSFVFFVTLLSIIKTIVAGTCECVSVCDQVCAPKNSKPFPHLKQSTTTRPSIWGYSTFLLRLRMWF